MRLDPDAVQAVGSADAPPRLSEVVTRRLAEDPAVTPSVTRTVLRALGAAESGDAATAFDHSGIFLSAIRVRGFRGIGPETTLQLPPGPGLTLVVGRNGSGKSSFAEAAEMALTGGNRRWDGRSAAWREGWRNLHDGAAARIELELLTAGDAPRLTIAKEWAADADLPDAHWTQRYPPAPPSAFDMDRWTAQLELYRPFLSYSELGALVDGKPSDLFDALHQLLGLDELTLAQERIRMRRLELERAVRDSRQERLELLELLASVADDRAVRVAGLLRPAQPDLAAVGREVLGVVDDPAGPDGLRAIVRLALPGDAEVEAVATRLETWGAAIAEGSTDDAEADLRLLELLRTARAHQAASGPCPCPVCGRGALDEDWARDTDAAIERIAARVDALTTARVELGDAVRAARALPELVPAELDFDPRNPPSVDTTAVREAWAEWAALTTAEYTSDLPELLRSAHARLVDELDLLQQGTRKELDRLDEVWTPLVPRIVTWLEGAREVAARGGTAHGEEGGGLAEIGHRGPARRAHDAAGDDGPLGVAHAAAAEQRRARRDPLAGQRGHRAPRAARRDRRRGGRGRAGRDEPGRVARAGFVVVPAARHGGGEPVPFRHDRRPGAGDGPGEGGRPGPGAGHGGLVPSGGGLHP
ncbi:ATP-binding protein [Nocardia beijingensis]|uniref:ATP-binding protein n=1 Tax=Nocardia beijingensis TaxID=95162 RepID=UPI001E2B86EF|nr:ATP-binding protein [Nocardia beijingensis]